VATVAVLGLLASTCTSGNFVPSLVTGWATMQPVEKAVMTTAHAALFAKHMAVLPTRP
jgi:hypothetical protein